MQHKLEVFTTFLGIPLLAGSVGESSLGEKPGFPGGLGRDAPRKFPVAKVREPPHALPGLGW